MSYKETNKELKVIQLSDNLGNVNVSPEIGSNTLYWWNKGDDIDGWYVKADLYDTEGDNIECLTAKSLKELKSNIKSYYDLDF